MYINDQLDEMGTMIRQSVCPHSELEYEFDPYESKPVLVAAFCEYCGKDVFQELTIEEVTEIGANEEARLMDDVIDSYRENHNGR